MNSSLVLFRFVVDLIFFMFLEILMRKLLKRAATEKKRNRKSVNLSSLGGCRVIVTLDTMAIVQRSWSSFSFSFGIRNVADASFMKEQKVKMETARSKFL